MARPVVLGVDSGTQSTKVVAVDLEHGQPLAIGRAVHRGVAGAEPPLSVQDPEGWWTALRTALAELRRSAAGDLDVRALAVAGQQHGFVALGHDGRPVMPAPLWNNTAAAPDAARLNDLADFAAEVGTRLVASVTIAKLAHLARTDPETLRRVHAICLPHDYLNLRLTGELATDRGDASGSGWWSPLSGTDRRDLLALAVGAEGAIATRLRLPAVRGPEEPAGWLTAAAAAALDLPIGIPVGPGTGDNMAAALGVGAAPGELVISLGTSGTAFAVSDHATADPTGEVCGFADATGRFLPLACMLNCTRVVDTMAALVGIERAAALDRAGAEEPGAAGLLLLPYFDGERTPNLPTATGQLRGISAATLVPGVLLRAAVDGVAAGLAYCVAALDRVGVWAPRVTLVGGGAAHPTWQQAIADVTGLPVTVRADSEHAARGAAIQAAAIVRGEPIAALAARWRPPVVGETGPRAGARERFRLTERREHIVAMRANLSDVLNAH